MFIHHLFLPEPRVHLEDFFVRVQINAHWRDFAENIDGARTDQQTDSDSRGSDARSPTPSGQHVPSAPNASPVTHVRQTVDIAVTKGMTFVSNHLFLTFDMSCWCSSWV